MLMSHDTKPEKTMDKYDVHWHVTHSLPFLECENKRPM
jgi:hypothetical protein